MHIVRHLKIVGRVQGVGYRMGMERKARELGVTGWVRNRLDGSVEAVVQGSHEAVAAIIDWARRGPRAAIVTDLQVSEASGEFSEFSARPTE